MTIFQKLSAIWKEDNLLRRVVKNSSYLVSSNVVSSGLIFVQGVIAVRLVGFASWGLIGAIQTFSSNVNRLLSFRMSEVVVKYLGPDLAEGKKREAAALVKAAALVEMVTSLVAFTVLALLASLAARLFGHDIQTAPWFIFYGLTLLTFLVYETSMGVLQTTNRFKRLGWLNVVQSVITLSVIFGMFLLNRWNGEKVGPYLVPGILLAYVLGKACYGVTVAVLAARELNGVLGKGWWRVSLRLLPEKRSKALFALNTNLYGTMNIAFRDNILLYVATLLSTTYAGYYKLAMAFISYMTQILDPLIVPTYTEIARTAAARQWETMLRLLKRISAITGTIVLAMGSFIAVAGWWLIPFVYGPESLPTYPILLILFAGYGFAGIFQWNRSLLLSLEKSNFPVVVTALTGVVELALVFWLVPRYGYLAMGAIVSGYFIVSIGVNVLRGLLEIRRQKAIDPSITRSNVPSPDKTMSISSLEREPSKPKPSPTRKSVSRRVNRWDWLVVAIFLAFAGVYFLGRLQGNFPVVILTGDAGNIASYAAALDHPGWFSADPVLGNPGNIGVYATIHIPLIRLLARWTGDYGLAYAWLAFPTTFLQLLGFYFLGRVLFKDRFWAFLLAFLTAMTVIDIGLGEIWGVWQDALPRVTFQALLPFLLALVWVWRSRPGRWPWLMVLVGLLVYVHPISAPAWGLAIWLSLWLLLPKAWTWKRRALIMFGLGLLFLLALTPFAVNYLSYRGRDQGADYATVMTILQTYMPANLLNVPAALGNFVWNMTRNLLLPLALVGGVATWLLKKTERTPVKVVLLWMAGIFVASVVFPYGEQLVEQRLHILPVETELVRCIRYFVPLLLLFWLWPLAELASRANRLQVRAAVAAGLVLFGFWGATNRPAVGDMLDAAVCFTKGRFVCPAERPLDELILLLRSETQPGDGVLFFTEDAAYTSQTLSVRYEALRPMVYTQRDAGTYSYADRSALPAWLETTTQWEALRAMADPAARLDGLISLAASLKAGYLVIDFPVAPETLSSLPVTVILQNDIYTLLELH